MAVARETLWKHSRRVLGDKYFAFLKGTEDPAPAALADQQANESVLDPKSEAYAKRREQIRRSQRTHRARTEKYVLGLEAEVGRLRLAHADCVALVKSLQREISQRGPQMECLSTARNTHLQHDSQDPANGSQEALRNSQLNTEPPADLQNSNGPPNSQVALCKTYLMLSAQTGLEFVMRLEEPCLNYVRRDLAASQDSLDSNNCLPTPPSPFITPLELAPEADQLILPSDRASAERLLALSSRLDLGDGLVTPIQAWDCIKAHPRAHLLTRDKMNDIIIRSYSFTACYRHGAALNKTEFEELLNAVLGEESTCI